MPHLLDKLRKRLGLPSPFAARHFRKREALRQDYVLLADALLNLLGFDSVLDVGCANAFLLERFAAAGKEVAGIEASPAVRKVLSPALADAVVVGDFTLARAYRERPWDLVSCVEVAEHVEPRRSRELVEVLAGAARRWIYFTAAPPGQRGRGHINCRPHEEWLGWFAEESWLPAAEESDALRRALGGLGRARWLVGNSFVLRPTTGR